MNHEDPANSPAGRGIVCVVAVFLFYLMSYGPVWGLVGKGTIPSAAYSTVNAFYKPITWVAWKLDRQLDLCRYRQWWRKTLS